ncbi:conserved hypothetical protein [Streptomyces scabiei 87.22]|uniref:Uncharacterized protein n=1 Tax=Streptomyces scabiei (strain 87.22) TaxID=680198 RepID=C9Z6R6_STRSW|nr:conserved hypothetical protein [Streptomyces scabiei 87.22]
MCAAQSWRTTRHTTRFGAGLVRNSGRPATSGAPGRPPCRPWKRRTTLHAGHHGHDSNHGHDGRRGHHAHDSNRGDQSHLAMTVTTATTATTATTGDSDVRAGTASRTP